jgi:hypothetical protein
MQNFILNSNPLTKSCKKSSEKLLTKLCGKMEFFYIYFCLQSFRLISYLVNFFCNFFNGFQISSELWFYLVPRIDLFKNHFFTF